MKRALALLVVLGTTFTWIGADESAQAANTVSSAALAATVILNAKGELSVRVDSSATIGAKRISIVTDAGRLGGEQKITLRQSGATNTVTVELIDNIIYVKGDATILENYMGLSKATSKQLSNKWFYIKDSSAEYDVVAQGITIASGMTEVALRKKVTSPGTKKIDGTKVTVLTGLSVPDAGPTFHETMYVTTSKKPLPVEVVQTLKGETATITFSKWDENIALSAPDAEAQLS